MPVDRYVLGSNCKISIVGGDGVEIVLDNCVNVGFESSHVDNEVHVDYANSNGPS